MVVVDRDERVLLVIALIVAGAALTIFFWGSPPLLDDNPPQPLTVAHGKPRLSVWDIQRSMLLWW